LLITYCKQRKFIHQLLHMPGTQHQRDLRSSAENKINQSEKYCVKPTIKDSFLQRWECTLRNSVVSSDVVYCKTHAVALDVGRM